MSKQLSILLTTTLTLSSQFQSALSIPTTDPASTQHARDALPLLSASATALKAQVTKLSLLAITSPFTHSAICSVLAALNESVLPSLVTAALLVTPNTYTKAFNAEIQVLSTNILKELSSLVEEVKNIAQKKDQAKKEEPQKNEAELAPTEKNVVTVSTGRVWDACDTLIDVAGKGVVWFVVRRVEEWRDLVRDAIKEIEEWDPAEEDDFFGEVLGEDGKEDDDDGEEDNTAALLAQKKSTIHFLKPIAQIYPAILTNRVKKAPSASLWSPTSISKLEALMVNLQKIPDLVDEAAGALYEENVETSIEHLKNAKGCAAEAINLVILPWDAEGIQQTDDKFSIWSKTWLKVMNEVSISLEDTRSA